MRSVTQKEINDSKQVSHDMVFIRKTSKSPMKGELSSWSLILNFFFY